MNDNNLRMSKKSKIKNNYFFQMIYQLSTMTLPLITSPYLARIIGPKGMGLYSYSNSVAYFFVIFSMMGILSYGNRTIAKENKESGSIDEVFSNLLMVHFLISVFVLSVYIFYIFNMSGDKTYAVIQIPYVLSGVFDISWFYFGIEKFKLTASANTMMKVSVAALIFIFVKTPDDAWKYCLIMAGGFCACQLVLWIPLHKYVKFVKPQFQKMIIHIKPMIVLFVPTVAVSIYRYMDKIMVGNIAGKIELGWYENAEKIIDVPMGIIGAFGTVMMPRMSNLVCERNEKEKVLLYIEYSMKYVMCIGVAFAFGIAAVARTFSVCFWGEDFMQSGNLIICLAATIPFLSFANVLRTQYLIPHELDKEFVSSIIAGALVNLIMNIYLIPIWGALGASIATIGAEMTVCILQTYFVRDSLPLKKYIMNSMIYYLIGAIMFIIVFFIGETREPDIPSLFIQIMSGAILYSTSILVLFLLKGDELTGRVVDLIREIKYKYFCKM